MSTLHVENLKGLSSGGNANKDYCTNRSNAFSKGSTLKQVARLLYNINSTSGML